MFANMNSKLADILKPIKEDKGLTLPIKMPSNERIPSFLSPSQLRDSTKVAIEVAVQPIHAMTEIP